MLKYEKNINFAGLNSVQVMNLFFTLFFCALTLLVFGYFLWQLYLPSVQRMQDKGYAVLHREYRKTIGRAVPDKSVVSAEECFTVENLFAAYNINYRHIVAVPSALVGIGILGTFFGLTVALLSANLSLENTDAAMATINSLIDGMKIAFGSSVAGMVLSILYGALLRSHINALQKQLNQIATELDTKYLLSPMDLLVQQTAALTHLGHNMGETIGGQIVEQLQTMMTSVLANVQAQMYQAGEYMAQSADSLNNAATEINKSVSNISRAAKTLDSTTDRLEKCQSAFDGFISEMGDAANQIQIATQQTEDVVNGLGVHIEAWNKATEQHVQSAGVLYAKIQMLVEEIDKLAQGNQYLQNTIRQLQESVGAIGNLQPDIEKIFATIQSGLIQYYEAIQTGTGGLLNEYTSEFTRACQALSNTTGQLSAAMQNSAGKLLDAMQQAVAELDKAKENQNTLAQ